MALEGSISILPFNSDAYCLNSSLSYKYAFLDTRLEKIASLVDVSISFVEKIKKELQTK